MNLSKFKDTIDNIESISPENLNGLIEETVSAFHTIQAKIASPNQSERNEGLEVAKELKDALEAQLQNLQLQFGMSTEQIEAYLADPNNLSADEFKSLDEARNELAQFTK